MSCAHRKSDDVETETVETDEVDLLFKKSKKGSKKHSKKGSKKHSKKGSKKHSKRKLTAYNKFVKKHLSKMKSSDMSQQKKFKTIAKLWKKCK